MFGSQPRRIYPTSAGGMRAQPSGGRMGPKPLMQSFALPGSYAAATYEEFGGDPYASGYQSGYAGGYGGGAVRKTSAISSDTNSRDPKDLKSRVFVGNVNTQLVDKLQLEKIYGRFGVLKAISVHKGFAFIQFTNENDARAAVQYTDGMSLVGQELDVNMANEPKPDRSSKSGNALKRIKMDSDAPRVFQQQQPTAQPQETPSNPAATETVMSVVSEINNADPGELQTYDTPDTLICGRCRQTFANWVEFRDHKKQPCEISSETEPIQIPQMEEINTTELKSNDSEVDPGPLRCFICKCENEFSSWELLKHLSTQHNMTVWFADRKEEPM